MSRNFQRGLKLVLGHAFAEVTVSHHRLLFLICPILLLTLNLVHANRSSDLVEDRLAVERVYHAHRQGAKQPFEQQVSPDLADRLVREDLHKEAVLKNVYGVEISSSAIAAEIGRINATTRAPAVLAELKASLQDDSDRFGQTIVKPLLVERELRERFENDEKLHASQRHAAERIRAQLISARQKGTPVKELVALFKQEAGAGQITETTCRLGKPPLEKAGLEPISEMRLKNCSGSGENTFPSPPAYAGKEQSFEDWPGWLQRVLRAQFHHPGDISAVVELPNRFCLYLCKGKTDQTLDVAALSIPKPSYELWLAKQTNVK